MLKVAERAHHIMQYEYRSIYKGKLEFHNFLIQWRGRVTSPILQNYRFLMSLETTAVFSLLSYCYQLQNLLELFFHLCLSYYQQLQDNFLSKILVCRLKRIKTFIHTLKGNNNPVFVTLKDQ